MTIDKLELLQEWQACWESLDGDMDVVQKMFGVDQGQWHAHIWNALMAYTRTLSALIGDEWEWLDWYANENHWGSGGLTGITASGEEVKVDTLEKLLYMIEAGHE